MNRQELRMYVYQLHSVYQPIWRKKAPLCPWCERPIDREFDLHEYLVKRSAVPKAKQELIMSVHNTIPVHHECHMRHGQTREMAHRCLDTACCALAPRSIGQWYMHLWAHEGLSIPRGRLIPVKECTFDMAKAYIAHEMAASQMRPPRDWYTESGDDARYIVFHYWWNGTLDKTVFQGKIGDEEYPWPIIVGSLIQGYWRSYLHGVIGPD